MTVPTDIAALIAEAKRLTLIDRISHEPVVAMLARVVSALESQADELRQVARGALVKVAECAEGFQHARAEVRERIYEGYSVDWSEGYDSACGNIAEWAGLEIERGQP